MPDHIPFEIQVEIMKTLPIKSLIQFRTVSKAWKSVIESSDFIAHYTIHNPTQPQHVLIRYTNLYSEKIHVSIMDDDSFPNNKVSLTVPRSVSMLKDSFVVGTSHGLVCLFGYYYRNPGDYVSRLGKAMAVIWNPSISKSVTIVVPDVDVDWRGRTAFGFGVCLATSDPKIVKINDTPTRRNIPPWEVDVFSLSSGVWRSSSVNQSDKLVVTFTRSRDHSPLFIDGSIYWFGTKESTSYPRLVVNLISFDLSSEEFREIWLPNELAFHDAAKMVSLKRISGSVAMIRMMRNTTTFEVWMMENGDSKPFTKLFYFKPYPLGCLLEFTRNGELIMKLRDISKKSDTLIVYEPFSAHINDLGIESQFYTLLVTSYTESLILLDKSGDDEDDEEISV